MLLQWDGILQGEDVENGGNDDNKEKDCILRTKPG